ncbi:hypothetical protein KQX54_004225 [Cotesia glomerata]|uniref:Uncharacterized protein n=1 Tax=Cotesia glomerata TaxID=32391 RepID=A0AAV7J467_COTGL|nr:hypothetical protein KQX54_004225 [Cotesia glomerata]
MQDCNNSKVFCKTESIPKSNQFSYVMEKVISNKHAAALYSTLELGIISQLLFLKLLTTLCHVLTLLFHSSMSRGMICTQLFKPFLVHVSAGNRVLSTKCTSLREKPGFLSGRLLEGK